MLIHADRSALLVVDIQAKLAPAMYDPERLVGNVGTLLEAARRIAIPIMISEQYPKGLGRTLEPILAAAPEAAVVEKVEFSAAANPDFLARFRGLDRPQAVVCGMEAHVCVLQTALDLLENGVEVAVVRDACASRRPESAEAAWRRLEAEGATVATTEMVVFEWLARSDSPVFRDVSKLIK
jgi:nicotinamidase-related amidase